MVYQEIVHFFTVYTWIMMSYPLIFTDSIAPRLAQVPSRSFLALVGNHGVPVHLSDQSSPRFDRPFLDRWIWRKQSWLDYPIDYPIIYVYIYVYMYKDVYQTYLYIYISNQKDRNMFPDVSLCRAPNSNWLVVSTPLKKMSSSVGMMTFPIYGKIIQMFQSTNQKVLS